LNQRARDNPEVNWEIRERALQRAKELSYQPNLAARPLVTGRTSLIGVIVPTSCIHIFAKWHWEFPHKA